MPVTGNIGALGWIAYAKEAVWGTAIAKSGFVNAAGSGFLPFESETLTVDIKPEYSSAINATRDADLYSFRGPQHTGGNVVHPLYPDLGADFLIAMVGSESMTIGSTPTSSTTLAASAAALATTISTTATFADQDIIQIDDLASGKAECRKVSGAPSGTGPFTVTLDTALSFAHTNGATVAKVVAPFKHYATPADSIASYTMLRYLGLDGAVATARQYVGMVPSKYKMQIDNKGEVKCTPEFIGQEESTITGTNIPTYVGATTTPVNWGTVTVATAAVGTDIDGVWTAQPTIETAECDIDNMIKEHYGLAGAFTPTLVVPTQRRTSGKLTAYWSGDTLFHAPFRAGTHTGLQLQALNSTGRGAVISLPEVNLEKFSDPLKIADAVMQDIDFRAVKNVALGTGIQVKVVNDYYLQIA